MNSLRNVATELRDKGYSYKMIKDELGVSISTMSYWFSNRPFTPNQMTRDRIKAGPLKNAVERHNRRVAETIQVIEQSKNEIGKLTKRDLWMLGLLIYIYIYILA